MLFFAGKKRPKIDSGADSLPPVSPSTESSVLVPRPVKSSSRQIVFTNTRDLKRGAVSGPGHGRNGMPSSEFRRALGKGEFHRKILAQIIPSFAVNLLYLVSFCSSFHGFCKRLARFYFAAPSRPTTPDAPFYRAFQANRGAPNSSEIPNGTFGSGFGCGPAMERQFALRRFVKEAWNFHWIEGTDSRADFKDFRDKWIGSLWDRWIGVEGFRTGTLRTE